MEVLKRLLFAFALAYSLSVLVARWGTPLSSPHAFRETQTAMTVYWMTHDGNIYSYNGRPELVGHLRDFGDRVILLSKAKRWINYQTPVLGPPWTIPFEFPTFQWAVAFAAVCGSPVHLTLDQSGRLVSWLFMIASLWPLTSLVKLHHIDPWILACLYLASPAYLYWGTAFLIETCSLFLCLMFLWMVEEERWVIGALIALAAGLTKVTTFVTFGLIGVLLSGLPRKHFRQAMATGVIVIVALASTVFWNRYTDTLKAQNPLSAVLMSSQPAQQLHNFGTFAQRLSWQPWEVLWASICSLL